MVDFIFCQLPLSTSTLRYTRTTKATHEQNQKKPRNQKKKQTNQMERIEVKRKKKNVSLFLEYESIRKKYQPFCPLNSKETHKR